MRLAEQINKHLVTFDDRFRSLVGRETAYTTFAKLTRDVVRPFRASVSIVQEANEMRSEIPLSGEFDLRKPKAKRINIRLHVPNGYTSVKLNAEAIQAYRWRIPQILQHELIHADFADWRHEHSITQDFNNRVEFYPSKRLSKQRISRIGYLTELEEIDAYAHDIAYEAKMYYPTIPALEVLRTATRRRYLHSLNIYQESFSGLDWTVVRKKLLSRAKQWVPEVILPPELHLPV